MKWSHISFSCCMCSGNVQHYVQRKLAIFWQYCFLALHLVLLVSFPSNVNSNLTFIVWPRSDLISASVAACVLAMSNTMFNVSFPSFDDTVSCTSFSVASLLRLMSTPILHSLFGHEVISYLLQLLHVFWQCPYTVFNVSLPSFDNTVPCTSFAGGANDELLYGATL